MTPTLTPTVAIGLKKECFKALMKTDKERIDHIFRVLLNETGITQGQMKSRTRERKVTEARQIAMYLIYNKVNLTLSKTGSMFFRDHSTVIYSLEVVSDLMQTDKKYKDRVERIDRSVSGLL